MKRFDYAIVLIERLKRANGAYCDVRNIAEDHHLPYAYLEKIAQALRRAGWLDSRRGAGGGYRLAKHPNDATVQALMRYCNHWQTYCPVSKLSAHHR